MDIVIIAGICLALIAAVALLIYLNWIVNTVGKALDE